MVTLCANQFSYIWNGVNYNTAGTYTDSLTSASGCDSLATLILNVTSVFTDTTTVTVCANQLPYSWNGVNYNTAGTYTDSLTSASGCDSLATLILNVTSVFTDTTTVTVCANQLPYSWNGVNYNAAGTYTDSLTSASGCDSLATLILNVTSVFTDTTRVTVCANQLPYSWNGVNYNAAGTYTDSLTSASGCDSLATLILNVTSVFTDTTMVSVCVNQLPYSWNGVNYNTAGTYTDSLTSASGCDSLATLILNVTSVFTDTTTVTVCANQLPYSWNGVNYNTAGTYTDSLTSASGCDSLATLILNVTSVFTDTTTVTVCANQLPYSWNGVNYNAAGTYTDSLTSASGCDSLATLILNVTSVFTDTTRVTVCANQLPYSWNGVNYNAAGTYTDSLTSASGCDSLATLILNVTSVFTDTTMVSVCVNQLPYSWNGVNYNAAGTYTDSLTSASGCDSLATLILNVTSVFTDTTTVTVCANQLPYNWNGVNYNAAGTYTDTLTSTSGCDSLATLILNVTTVFTDTTTVTVCANYNDSACNEVYYHALHDSLHILTSASGCDSLATLILNVTSVFTDTTTVTVCANQLPYSWNGVNYNAAGTYTDSLTSASGCDSLATLVLNVTAVFTDTTTVTVWANQLPYNCNGVNYTTAGT